MIDSEQPDPTDTRSPTGTATKGTTPTGTSSASPTRIDSPTPSPTDAPTKTPTSTATRTTSPTPTPVFEPTTTYTLGEWHKWDMDPTVFTFSVTEIQLKTTYTLEGSDDVYEMPENEQLAIAHLDVKHSGDGYTTWYGAHNVAFVYDRAVYTWRETEFPDRIGYPPKDLESVDHQKHFQSEGVPVPEDGTADFWPVTVLPRDASPSDVTVGFDANFDDNSAYPVRWIPSEETRTSTASPTGTGTSPAGK